MSKEIWTGEEWKVLEWDVVDGGILGAVIACPLCGDADEFCSEAEQPNGCSGSGEMHQPYHLPDGSMIDMHQGGVKRGTYLLRTKGGEAFYRASHGAFILAVMGHEGVICDVADFEINKNREECQALVDILNQGTQHDRPTL